MSKHTLQYMTGFGNEFDTEALADALPIGQFSPQKVNYGLYAEQFSTTAFTAPRADNRRSWLYRIRPSVVQGDYQPLDNGLLRSAPITEVPTPPLAHVDNRRSSGSGQRPKERRQPTSHERPYRCRKSQPLPTIPGFAQYDLRFSARC